MWYNLKEMTNNNNCGTPRNLVINGELVNKPSIMANHANNFFISKIRKIRNNFPINSYNPLLILKKLTYRNKNNFILPELRIEDAKTLIKKAKNSWTLCNGELSMNVIKKLNPLIAPHITHLFNCIIRSGTYPKIMKV